MRILKAAALVAWLASAAVCMFLATIVGKPFASDLVIGVAAATFFLTCGVFFLLAHLARGSVLPGVWLGIPCCALGVGALNLGGLLPDVFRLVAVSVFLAWFALTVLLVGIANWSTRHEADKPGQSAAPPRQAGRGWSMQQLALVLMLAGVFGIVLALKCLLFGPPPYSMFAYVIGPSLIVASYLVEPGALPDLLRDYLARQKPPAAKDG